MQHMRNNLLILICLLLVTSVDTSESSKNMITASSKILEVFESTLIVYTNEGKFNKKKITTMINKMDKLFDKISNSRNTQLDDITILAEAYYNICYLYMKSDKKEELHIARDSILRCLNLIKDKELEPNIIFLALRTYHTLGFLHNKQNKLIEAIEKYDKAVDLYLAYINQHKENYNYINLDDIAVESPIQTDNEQHMKKIYINILNSLIEIHMYFKPINRQKLIRYIHQLLTAEWHKLPETKEYFEWIEKAMKLCIYLLIHNCFKEAKYYILIGIYLQTNFIDKECKCTKKEKKSWHVCKRCKQTVVAFKLLIIHQGKYGLMLLRKSAERLLRLEKDDDSEVNKLKLEDPRLEEEFFHKLIIKIEEECSIPNKYIKRKAKYISNYEEAQLIFLDILHMFNHSGIHNDRDIKTYENIILDTCKAYKYIALFEKDTAILVLFQKQRIEILINAINFIHWTGHKVSKYLRLQLAIAYSALISIKFENLESAYLLSTTSSHNNDVAVEIANLLENGLENLCLYMEY